MTSAGQSSSSAASTSTAPATKAKKKAGKDLDPVEIEAKRRARAEKKEREAQEKAQKEAEALASGLSAPVLDAQGRPLYQPRAWASIPGTSTEGPPGKKRIKVLSWNILAQGLIRRKLFPGSDALRWKDREAGLAAELVGHTWDVGCFQEVDRQATHAETLQKAGFSHLFAKGYPQKQHGLMLAWRSTTKGDRPVFEKEPVASQTIFFDDEEVSPGRTACSRITRNIALFAALRFGADEGQTSSRPEGIIVATTHLFWHPMHGYERLRQVGLLSRALDRFRRQTNAEWSDWPTILAGDFNDQPHSASYGLLTGRGMADESLRQEILTSRVIHQSIDDREKRRAEGLADTQKLLASSATETSEAEKPNGEIEGSAADGDEAEAEEEGDDEEGEAEEAEADDQMLKNCRAATENDALLTLDEFEELYDLSTDFAGAAASSQSRDVKASSSSSIHLRSTYASAYHLLEDPSEKDNLFSSPQRGRERWDDPDWKEGDVNVHAHLQDTDAGREPMWTHYSALFSLTLDYVLLFPLTTGADESGTKAAYPTVTKLLRTHRTEVLKGGLPRKGICVSDHISVGAEIEI